MIKYAKITNNETKTVDVLIGTDIQWAVSKGFEQIDVTQSFDGNWYLTEALDTPEYKAAELEKARELKLQEISTKKEIAFKTGVVFNGGKFDCDDRAQTRLLFQFSQSKEGDTIIWLDYDYKPIEFDYENFAGLCDEVTTVVSGIEFKTGEYIATAKTAQTIEALEEIEINY